MKGSGRGILRPLLFGILVLGLVALGAWRLDTASGDGAVLNLTKPTSVPAGDFQVQVEIQNAPPPEAGCPDPEGDKICGLATYEWVLRYDPDRFQFKAATDGGFLTTSTGRGSLSCSGPTVGPAVGVDAGNVRFGCVTIGHEPNGASGAGLLSTVTFSALASGAVDVDIEIACAGLADPYGNSIPIGNVPACVSAITPTPGPSETPGGPSPTPGGPSPTPGGPSPTPGGPTATPTPTATPAGPTPTPTPLPPGYEAVELAAGCNPVASTYPDATPIGTIAAAVGPAGNLNALWQFEGGVWLGYSPAYPEVSDLTTSDLLDVVFICVMGPGSFGRPIV